MADEVGTGTYSVVSEKSFDDAVRTVEEATAQKGFRVLHVHDVAATLKEKGFESEPVKIVEICNARYASRVLAENREISAFLPCRISVYQDSGQTRVSGLLPSMMADYFSSPDIGQVAQEVDAVVRDIVDRAR